MDEKTLIALEIGSSKIKGAVGTVDATGSLNVKIVEEERICDIVRHGCIRNVVETEAAVRNVITKLEKRLAPRRIQTVYLNIGGRSLASMVTNIERRLPQEAEITRSLIEEITDEALSSTLPDRDVVSVTPREILVDNSPAPRPIGMMGSCVGARLNLITCRSQIRRNLSRVIEDRLGMSIADTFVRPLAEADLVLTPEEKRLGCMLVDFGAETTTVAIFKGGVLIHLATLPLGSRNITRDITALNHLEERAEELKILGGSALPTGQDAAGGPGEYAMINNYVGARAGEIILNIVKQIEYAGITADRLAEGIIIVGRGARLNGFNQRLSQMSGMKVRTGTLSNRVRILDGRISPADAVDVISILAEAARNNPRECLSPRQPEPRHDVNPVPEQPEFRTYAEQRAYAERQRAYAEQQSKPEQAPYRQPQEEIPAEHQPYTGQQPYTSQRPYTETRPVGRPAPAAPVDRNQPPMAEYSNPAAGGRPAVVAPKIEKATDTDKDKDKEKDRGPKSSKWGVAFAALRDRVANLVSDTIYENEDE